ncbi:hypothetical protein FAF44_03145 [Nonomuraea sp. MG754425]|uniref:hypothetical protein n=1 Tax=Nonomuraea sp. MG754425 TaxID=2570319 RepID=UPI001F23CE50|nr:hypothetical protein [Nonomuraea sp. MG754425]MCF6467412.1 hypothetical protein [Nonomuraea sp. MG754425]
MTSDDMPSVALSLETLRRLVEVGFAQVNGQIALLRQELEQVNAQHANLSQRVEQDRLTADVRHAALESRLDALEREAVTRSQLADRTRLIIAIVGVLVTVASAVIALIALTRG